MSSSKFLRLMACMPGFMSVAIMAQNTPNGEIPVARTTPSVETAAPDAPPFPAWEKFSAGIHDLWPRIYAKLPPRLRDDPQVRQEAARLLLSAITQQAIEAISADGDHPVFLPFISMTLNLAQPNADTTYRSARITPGGVYRLRGTVGSLPISKIGQLGPTAAQTGGGTKALGYLDLNRLKTDKAGRFDVLVSVEKPTGYVGEWWKLDPATTMLMIRQMGSDWFNEKDPTLAIERVDVPVARPRPSAEELSRRLTDIPRKASNIASFLVDHAEGLRNVGYINKLRVFDVSNGAALQGQFYYEGAYDLKPDQALIVEAKVPSKCVYYSMILTNQIYETTDWYNNLASLNNSQVKVDRDGILRIVVSAKDPGVPNWLDTSGYPEGVLQGRWTDCNDQPVPVVKLVPLTEVRASLPADTPRVTPEQREQQVRDRRAAAQMRPLW